VAPDGQTVAVGCESGTLRLWDVARRKASTIGGGHNGPVLTLLWLPDDKVLVSAGISGGVQVSDLEKKDRKFGGKHYSAVRALAYGPTGSLLFAAGNDGAVRRWSLSLESELEPPVGHRAGLLGVAVSPDGKILATAGADGTVRLWSLETLQEKNYLEHRTAPVSAVVFCGDGRRLFTGSWDGAVRIWDPESARELERIDGQRGKVMSVAVSSNGNLLAVGSWFHTRDQEAGDLRLWDVPNKRAWATLKSYHSQGITAVALSPDGRLAASGGWDGIVRLAGSQSGAGSDRLDQGAPVECLAFHPAAGETLAVGDRKGGVKIWNLKSRKPVATLAGHTEPLAAVAFSPDGQTLVSADLGGKIIYWDWSSASEFGEVELPGEVRGVAFTPDSRYLATANANGTAYLLRLPGNRQRP
jgi:WD40 repeat protein